MKEEVVIISLGGSLIVPDGIDTSFVKNFTDLIRSQVAEGKKFVIITGGGKTSRHYTDAIKKIIAPSSEDLDWIGIAATRANAELLRVALSDIAHKKISLDPDVLPESDMPIIVGGGWKAGHSSDMAAVHSAISAASKRVVNLSNIDYVYEKDPKKYPDAKKIEKISWHDFRKILPADWEPGSNTPFDPISAAKAEASGIEVDILNGSDMANIEKCLNGEEFKGTKIS